MARNLRIASVVVDLVANSARYIAELKKANRDTQRYAKRMASSFTGLTANIAGMAAGYLSVTAAIESFNNSLNNARQIDTLARLAGQSVEEFQAAAYAVERYGITAEQLGDISKDVSDKLGDFIATGGGEFKDFFEQVAPQVGLTADALQGLSGPQVLVRVKKAMEDANVPMEQQIFYLESIANDATKLIPLLADNGAELNRLTGQFNDMDVALSETDIKVLKDMETAFANARKEADSLSSTIWVKLSGAMTALADSSAEFFKQFKHNVENAPEYSLKFQIETLEKQVRASEQLIDNYRQTIKDGLQDNATASQKMGVGIASSRLNEEQLKLDKLTTSLTGLKAELATLTAKPQTIQIDIETPGKKKKSNGSSVKVITEEAAKAGQKALDNLKRQLATQTELIDLNAQRQIDSVYSMELTKDQITKAGFDNRLQLESHYLLQIEAERLAAHDRLKEDVKKTTEETGELIGKTTEQLASFIGGEAELMANVAENFAYDFSSQLADMVMTGKADFASLAQSIISDILRIAIQAKIVQPLMQSMGILPAPAAAPAATTPAGLATGGPVMRGKTYLVGEKGPELFTASNTGNIVPNNQLGSSTQVNIYTQPGETAETRTRQGENGDIIEVFMKQVDSRMNEQISRGQGLARTLEGRYALSRKSY